MQRRGPKGEGAEGVTIVDIARQAGVSIKTVSRVVNREDGVGPEARARIEALIAQLGYRPNVAARLLSSRRSYLIGVIFLRMGAYHYIGEVQAGAMRACRRAGYQLVVEQVGEGVEGARETLIQTLRAGRFDGLILTPPVCDDPELLNVVESHGLAYVRVAPGGDFGRSPYVFMDDTLAGQAITDRLLDLGHRRIAFIDGPQEHTAAARRRKGYLAALASRGVALDADWIQSGDFESLSGFEAAERLLDLPNPPTAVFAANDGMAVGVLAAAAKRGLAVPGSLSVVGFDDSPVAASAWPRLTTVHQPVAEMAEAAADMLIDGFGDKRFRGRTLVRQLDFRVVDRASTAPPRKSAPGL
ncbi:LacI family transcriptional regulator [Caulobacter sp. Root656]|nr:LacI family transcriptional regulator [Caulobacter sp. Root656]